jgi:transposase
MDLTEAQWAMVERLIQKPRRRKDGRGRPWREPREVLGGILWVLRTGAPWKDLPQRYPPYQTCHRRFQHWCRNGTLKRILNALAEDLYERGGIDLTECFIDGTFTGAKKGALALGRQSGGRAPKSWPLQIARVFLWPLESQVHHPMRLPLWRRRSTTGSSGPLLSA